MKQLLLDLIPSPHPSFDNFVPGRNAEALFSLVDMSLKSGSMTGSKSSAGKAFEAISHGAAADSRHHVLYLWGETGSGKTHLLSALKNITGTVFLKPSHLERPLNVEKASGLHYVLDNAQTLNDAQQIGLFNLINRVHALTITPSSDLPAVVSAKPAVCVIVAGNVAPRDLALRSELTSRLGSGLVFQLHPLSETEKAAALRAHAKTRSFTLREEVIAYLLRHTRRDMASLIAMLDALDTHSLETGREITLPLLREISQPELSSLRSGSLVNSLPTPSPTPSPNSLPNLQLTIPTRSL